jgi:hypothetical protein
MSLILQSPDVLLLGGFQLVAPAVSCDLVPRLADGVGAVGHLNVRLEEPDDLFLLRRGSFVGNKESVRFRGESL